MIEARRQFNVITFHGREFSIVEFATFRWERNAVGERYRIENEGRDYYTVGGFLVVPTGEPWTYKIPELGLLVHEFDDFAADESARGARRQAADSRRPKTIH